MGWRWRRQRVRYSSCALARLSTRSSRPLLRLRILGLAITFCRREGVL